LGDRWLWFAPALSLCPGQAPTHEDRHFSEEKAAAVGPTSATQETGHFFVPMPFLEKLLGVLDLRSTASACARIAYPLVRAVN